VTAAVEVADVWRSFGKVNVLAGVTLTTEPGQVVAVYGRSGSGKTTLVNLVGGLDHPDRGSIRVAGVDLATRSPAALSELRRTHMGFVFQSYGLLAHLSAWDNVEFGQRLAGVPRREWRERTAAALDGVGLAARAKHWPAELSGGERQRVAIARVLAVRPKLVLADEPTGALDHVTSLVITDLLVGYAREYGASVWIATHDAGVAERVDQVYRITEGRLTPEAGVRT
jgi:putative ABC transport system ATP-binding protein